MTRRDLNEFLATIIKSNPKKGHAEHEVIFLQKITETGNEELQKICNAFAFDLIYNSVRQQVFPPTYEEQETKRKERQTKKQEAERAAAEINSILLQGWSVILDLTKEECLKRGKFFNDLAKELEDNQKVKDVFTIGDLKEMFKKVTSPILEARV